MRGSLVITYQFFISYDEWLNIACVEEPQPFRLVRYDLLRETVNCLEGKHKLTLCCVGGTPDIYLRSLPECYGLTNLITTCKPDILQIGKDGWQQVKNRHVTIHGDMPDIADKLVEITPQNLSAEDSIVRCAFLKSIGEGVCIAGLAPVSR